MKSILILLSHAGNTICGGSPYMMVSTRAWRDKNKYMIYILDSIFFWEENHCYNCYLAESKRIKKEQEEYINAI